MSSDSTSVRPGPEESSASVSAEGLPYPNLDSTSESPQDVRPPAFEAVLAERAPSPSRKRTIGDIIDRHEGQGPGSERNGGPSSSGSTRVGPFALLLNSIIECDVQIIPYAELRQGALIGSGHTFTVFEGTYHEQNVALKFMNGVFADDAPAGPRIRSLINQVHTEIRIMTAPHLRNQAGIVDLLGLSFKVSQTNPAQEETAACVTTVEPIVVMPLASASLAEYLQDDAQNVGISERIGLFEDIVCGLSALHETGFVIRDIKPDNVLLFADGTEKAREGSTRHEFGAKVADFGFATTDVVSREAHHTSGGIRGWTANWCPPEVS